MIKKTAYEHLLDISHLIKKMLGTTIKKYVMLLPFERGIFAVP
jgi:hypothetical protein